MLEWEQVENVGGGKRTEAMAIAVQFVDELSNR
jgi:hypothetical protein